jgi:acyl-CoA dehydrogenase
MTVDDLLVGTCERILAQTCSFEAVEQAETDGWCEPVWNALAAAGLPWVGVPESCGGVGGSLLEALAVLRSAGRHAAPVPLAETGLLAGWLLAESGLCVGDGPLTVAPGTPADDARFDGAALRGTIHDVPWGRQARRLVGIFGDRVAVVDLEAARVEPAVNLAGEPRDRVDFDGTAPLEVVAAPVDRRSFKLRGALTRIVLMAGALERLVELSLAYASERQQFGRPVARFQLVQAHLVHLAQDAALVGLAADAAGRAMSADGDSRFEVAAARVLACSAASTATRAAHQVHGAMGMTREYPLHHFSRRLWSWRNEYGNEHYWRLEAGRQVATTGADDLYPLVTR